MEIIRSIRAMQETARNIKERGLTIGFVPTMGALHQGHLSLIKRCKEENHVTVVSIFVNPIQFGPSEDYTRYPRDMEGDIEKLSALEVDILFFPEVKDIYPDDYKTYITVEDLSGKMCGAFRPGHFRGVATVVAKLFNIVKPDRAYFGQKDYQQTVVIRKMVEDLNFDVDIVVCPTIRERDGLAMSSRNLYLNEDERRAATLIYQVLKRAEEMVLSGESFDKVRDFMNKTLSAEPLIREIQYASLFHPERLEELSTGNISVYKEDSLILAAAVILGNARLIDNIVVDLTK